MLGQFVLASIENGLNLLLQTDPPSLARLQQLEGQVIAVQVADMQMGCYLLPHRQGIQLAQHWAAPASCTLTGTAAQLAQLAASQEKTRILHQQGMSIVGNSGALMELAQILQDMELDWPYLLQKWLGPVAAGLLAGHLNTRMQWARQGAAAMRDNMADYLTEESRLLVGRQEAQIRFAELEQLQLRLDRLQARTALISQRITPAS